MTGNIHGKLNKSLDGLIKLIKLLFMDFAPAIFGGVAAIIVIFTKLPIGLAATMLLVIPIGLIIIFRQISTQQGIRIELLEEKVGMDGTVVELINGIEFIRVTDNAENEVTRFSDKSEELRRKEMKHHKSMALYDCLKFINEAVFTVLIIGFSTYLAGEGIISVGSVLTAYLCFTQLTTPLRELHRIFDELSESTILAKEYFNIIDLKKDFSYRTKKNGEKIEDLSFIEIKNLNFSYSKVDGERKSIISNLDLEIEKAKFIGIAGPSGCGKSSLIKVLTKLEEKDSGRVIIDGRDIDTISREEMAKEISLVPQTPFLIAGTIRENICYGINHYVSDAELKEATKRAYIDDFIENLPDKYETMVAEGGNNLSGGQKQRIAIARIFLRKPKILILDEATSALDNTSEKYIQLEIEKLREENQTTIISIAHRLTTLKNCDEIIDFDKGNIIQLGNFVELTTTEGVFKDMYEGKLK